VTARRRLERRWLGLPSARSETIESSAWMTAADGVRLAAHVLRPADASARRGTVLIRTERARAERSPLERLARWLAEDGRTVVVQSCRGRNASEGEFRPFRDEVTDGGDALRWVAEQSWFDGDLVLLGLGYSAFAAWAALSAAPTSVAALVVGFGARDPYAWLHPGGALQLEAALALAARLDGRTGHDPSALDLARAAHHRPLVECDRVALRELPAFRDWLAHPERDAWWRERTPELPDPLPRALFVNGWYECALPAAFSDYELACARSAEASTAPELLLGPWGAAPVARDARVRGARDIPELARKVVRFVAHAVGARAVRDLPARVFVRGGGWRESLRWPPGAARECTLYLGSGGFANSDAGDGRLVEQVGQERADTFVSDPADPVPSLGGASVGDLAGALDQGAVEERGDVLCYTSDPLPDALELAGRVSLVLHAPTQAREDTCAKLVAVAPDGTARWLAEGVARAGSDTDAFAIELGAAAARLAAGTRLRVEVAGSSLPRFARPEPEPAQRGPRLRTVYHGGARPSALRFQVS
jgi:putative CocE/NonD family hydrolase